MPQNDQGAQNAAQNDDTAVTETCFPLPVSDFSLISEAKSRNA